MRGPNSRFGSPLNARSLGGRSRTLGLAVLVGFHLGCTSATPNLQELKDSLSLELVLPASAFRIGETVEAALSLRNRGTTPLEACVGDAANYHIFGTMADRGRQTVIDHPQCMTRFKLAPGEVLEWSEPIAIGDVGSGPARLFATVQIVSLEGCDRRYGCYDISVSTGSVPIEIRAASGEAN